MLLNDDWNTRRSLWHWLLHSRERVPGMSGLTSRTLPARTTRTAGQTRQPIRRGWFTACSTVFGQSVFELLDPGIRLGQLLFQRQQFRDERFERSIFFTQGLQFFFFRYRCTLVGVLSFGKSVGDLSSTLFLSHPMSHILSTSKIHTGPPRSLPNLYHSVTFLHYISSLHSATLSYGYSIYPAVTLVCS